MKYFTSDLHYFHVRILEICPHRKDWGCSTMEEMNEQLIKNFNSKVSPNDITYFLGDVVMGLKSNNVPSIVPRLNGTKILILGNHDAGFGRREKFEEAKNFYMTHGFSEVYAHSLLLQEDGVEIRLCHFPYARVADHEDYKERYAWAKMANDGTLLLHGHTHSRNKHTGPNMLHIGVDAWDGFPVSLETILKEKEMVYDADSGKS